MVETETTVETKQRSQLATASDLVELIASATNIEKLRCSRERTRVETVLSKNELPS
jgi:hypothetical protein